MKTAFKWILIASLALGLIALLTGGLLWHEIAAQPDVSISVNGEDLDVEGLGGLHWVGALFGVVVAGLAICILLPLILLFSVGLPLLILGLVLAFVLVGAFSFGAMLFSPFILLVLLLWWMLRSKKPAPKLDQVRNDPRLTTTNP